MRSFTIANKTITDDGPAYVLAELSHNHLGSLELAREMIRVAAECGADAVKFQKRGPSTYEGLRTGGEAEYADMRQAREFNIVQYADLSHYAHSLGLGFVATAFDQESADLLHRISIDAIKVASGDITNTPLLKHVASLGKPMIVSTGGCEMEDVRAARDLLKGLGAEFCLLHCTSQYPCAAEHVNLQVIETFQREFPDTVIGLSSHVHRYGAGLVDRAAYVLGARVFESHFTLTPDIGTGEHAFARDRFHLLDACLGLKTVPIWMGDGIKRKLPDESVGIKRLGKSLIYARALPAGYVLTSLDLAAASPGDGLPPNRIGQLVGRSLIRSVRAGERATLEGVSFDA